MFSNYLTVQIKLRPPHQWLEEKSISIRVRQWRANGGFIIACSQDKRVNQIQSLHRKQQFTAREEKAAWNIADIITGKDDLILINGK